MLEPAFGVRITLDFHPDRFPFDTVFETAVATVKTIWADSVPPKLFREIQEPGKGDPLVPD